MTVLETIMANLHCCPMDSVLACVCSCNCSCCTISSHLRVPWHRKVDITLFRWSLIGYRYRLSAVTLH